MDRENKKSIIDNIKELQNFYNINKDIIMQYDHNTFLNFKEKSIKSLLEFVPGKIYYSNSYHREFTFIDLRYKNSIMTTPGWDAWIEYCGHEEWLCSRDHNIGASYNPWLIFVNKKVAIACEKELIVTYSDIQNKIP